MTPAATSIVEWDAIDTVLVDMDGTLLDLSFDTFFWRAGDVMSAALVFVGVTMLGLGTSGFARVNLVLAGIWLLLAVAVGREYVRKSKALESDAAAR